MVWEPDCGETAEFWNPGLQKGFESWRLHKGPGLGALGQGVPVGGCWSREAESWSPGGAPIWGGAGSQRWCGKGALVLEPWFGRPWAQESWLRALPGCSPGTVLGLRRAQSLGPPGRWSSGRRRSSCGANGGLQRTRTCLHRVLEGGWRLALTSGARSVPSASPHTISHSLACTLPTLFFDPCPTCDGALAAAALGCKEFSKTGHTVGIIIPGGELLPCQGRLAPCADQAFSMPGLVAVCHATLCQRLWGQPSVSRGEW